MEIPKKLPPIGARIIKSSVAVALCISPYVSTQQTVDAFGNNVTAGYMRDGLHRP